MDECIEDQNQFEQLIVDLIDNLEFEDTATKEKDEKKEASTENPSSDNEENNDKDASRKEEEQNEDFNLGVAEDSPESFDENEESSEKETKEIDGNDNLTRKNKTNLLKQKYKVFTSDFDEIKNAE